MGLLDKLLSLIGGGSVSDDSVDHRSSRTESSGERRSRTTPSTGTEDAVKGTETAGEVAGDAPGGPEPSRPRPDAAEKSVTVIKGIGPAYRDRLATVGIETVGDLAAADPAGLSEATDISEKRLTRWVGRARNR